MEAHPGDLVMEDQGCDVSRHVSLMSRDICLTFYFGFLDFLVSSSIKKFVQ